MPVPPTRAWETAEVVAVTVENPRVKTFRLRFPSPVDYLAGQHCVVRLRAPDGYTAQRSYSIASAPDGSAELDLTVERLPDGEVSSFLHEVVEPGDALEVRGPIGGWFVWDGAGAATLVGGGSGVVPLMAMLRHARRTGSSARLVVSVRTPADVIYRDELVGREDAFLVYSRTAPPGAGRPAGRLGAADLADVVTLDGPGATVYVCGSSGFVEAASGLLTGLGVPAEQVRIERFGPS